MVSGMRACDGSHLDAWNVCIVHCSDPEKKTFHVRPWDSQPTADSNSLLCVAAC